MKTLKSLNLLMVVMFFFDMAHAESVRTNVRWNVGDQWEIDTTLYSRDWMLAFSDPVLEQKKNEEKVLSKYLVTVRISAEVPYQGTDCWQIDFSANDQAPKGVRENKYSLLISKQDGSMKKIFQTSGKNVGSSYLEDVDGITILSNPPYGFPLEMIQWQLNTNIAPTKNPRLRVSANLKEINGEKSADAKVEVKGCSDQPASYVSQKWDDQHQWWTEYEKVNRGHKELVAKLKIKSKDEPKE